jgi:hypothetical protein
VGDALDRVALPEARDDILAGLLELDGREAPAASLSYMRAYCLSCEAGLFQRERIEWMRHRVRSLPHSRPPLRRRFVARGKRRFADDP